MEEEEAADLSANLEDSNPHNENKLVIKVSTKTKVLPTIPEEEIMEDQADSNMNKKYEFDGFLDNKRNAGNQKKYSEKEMENNQKDIQAENSESENEKEKWKCGYCGDQVKKMMDCDRCHKWACKKCVGVSSIPKMKQIGSLTEEAKGLVWQCNECRKEIDCEETHKQNIIDEIGYKNVVIE